MPELPEIETMLNAIKPEVINKDINKTEVFNEKVIAHPDIASFLDLLQNRKIKNLYRKGKFILIELDKDLTLAFHMRMTGKLFMVPKESPLEKHTHFILSINNSPYELRFVDTRRFGRIWLCHNDELDKITGIDSLGVDPLTEDFNFNYFKEKIGRKKQVIKNFLLDQHNIAGIGNIYADEILFESGIHPERKVNTLSDEEIEKLINNTKKILNKSIEINKATAKEYFEEENNYRYNEFFKVYNKSDTKCPNCGNNIVRKKIGQRSSHFCPHCQKL